MARQSGDPNWVKVGEKFAVIGLGVPIERDLRRVNLPGGLIALPNAAFEFPKHWREWLGTLRIEDVEECSLFLVATMPSTQPGVLDGESKELQARVGHWFMGLVLERNFSPYGDPFMAVGERTADEVDVRSYGSVDPPRPAIVMDRRPITSDQLVRAATIAERLGSYTGPWGQANWRLLRCIDIYRRARNDNDILDRIHQFTRCIEGLIAPVQGGTKRQFKSRTELFVGPSRHDLMGEIYDVRSAIEHLHEYKYLEARDRETRVRLAQLEAIAEFVARSCIARIVLDPALASHFGGVSALDQFWTKTPAERKAIWGDSVDPETPLRGFEFRYLNDEQLGVR